MAAARRPGRSSRASSGSSGSSRLAAASSSGGASLPRLRGEGDLRTEQLGLGALQLVERPGLGRRRAGRAPRRTRPPGCLACAAASARAGPPRRVGCQRRRRAPGTPPPRPGRRAPALGRPSVRAPPRPSSSGPAAACARCQARRSGSSSRVGRLGQRPVRRPPLVERRRTGRPPSAPADAGTAPCVPNSSRPAVGRGAAASAPIPSRSAARQSSAASPTGRPPRAAAAAASRPAAVASRRRKLVLDAGPPAAPRPGARSRRPAPPASVRAAAPAAPAGCRASRRRSGREPASSIGPQTTESSSARASASARPRRRAPAARPASSLGVAHGEDQRDRLRQQPPGDEREGLRRRAVEPLRVVDQADQRLLARPPRTAGSAPPARPGTVRRGPGARGRTRSAAHPAAAPGSRSSGPASARTADAARRRPAPSPTGRRRPARPGSPAPARPGTPAAPSCPRPASPCSTSARLSPAPDSLHQLIEQPGARRRGRSALPRGTPPASPHTMLDGGHGTSRIERRAPAARRPHCQLVVSLPGSGSLQLPASCNASADGERPQVVEPDTACAPGGPADISPGQAHYP